MHRCFPTQAAHSIPVGKTFAFSTNVISSPGFVKNRWIFFHRDQRENGRRQTDAFANILRSIPHRRDMSSIMTHSVHLHYSPSQFLFRTIFVDQGSPHPSRAIKSTDNWEVSLFLFTYVKEYDVRKTNRYSIDVGSQASHLSDLISFHRFVGFNFSIKYPIHLQQLHL